MPPAITDFAREKRVLDCKIAVMCVINPFLVLSTGSPMIALADDTTPQ